MWDGAAAAMERRRARSGDDVDGDAGSSAALAIAEPTLRSVPNHRSCPSSSPAAWVSVVSQSPRWRATSWVASPSRGRGRGPEGSRGGDPRGLAVARCVEGL